MSKKYSRRSFINQTVLASSGLLIFGCVLDKDKGATENMIPTKPLNLTSNSEPGYYQEAPMLTKLVEEGKLPPVEQRLPKVPFTREVDSIGNYGGTLYDDSSSQGGRFMLDGALVTSPQETNNEGTIVRPHMCERVLHNKDYTEFHFYIREGLRWSDGVELTSDDVIWWWEHEQNHAKLYPEGPKTAWKIGEDYARFEKVSKWCFKISFQQPFRPLINVSVHEWMSFSNFFCQPAHYMKQFHIDFNPQANELAKSYGYEAWYQLYKEREEYMRPHEGKPGLSPWVRVITETTHDVFERNPYYAEVDPEGNQLPYVDKLYISVVEDRKLQDARIATGGVSMGRTVLSQIGIFKKNEKQGDFHIKKWTYSNSSECMLAFNLNHKDPVLKELYNDLRFRKAMSVAINRKKINDSLFFGMAKECQATLNPDVSYFDPDWLTYYANYNIDEANELLDEMGLDWDDKREYRLRPDGKRFKTVLIYSQTSSFPLQIVELIREDWRKTGVDVILKQSDAQFRKQRCMSGDHDCTAWNADLTEEIPAYMPWITKWSPNNALYYAMDWWYWYYSDGKNGEEPPEHWKEQFNNMAKWYSADSEEEYQRLGHKVWDFFSKELVCIGTVGYAPIPVVVKNGLMNVKDSIKMGYGTVWAKSFMVQTFYWDNPEAHI